MTVIQQFAKHLTKTEKETISVYVHQISWSRLLGPGSKQMLKESQHLAMWRNSAIR